MSNYIEVKAGWWRQRNGGVALITGITDLSGLRYPVCGVGNVDRGGSMSLSWGIDGSYTGPHAMDFDLMEYLGPLEVPDFAENGE